MSIFKPGTIINNYKIDKQIGKNKLGAIYKGSSQLFDKVSGEAIFKQLTIKTINLGILAGLGLDPKTIQDEINYLEKVSGNPICNQYIACYYNSFIQVDPETQNQYLVVVTDYIEGLTLQEILSKQGHSNFELSRLLQMMAEIAQAVDYIHGYGIAHQNIKPQNIILDVKNNRLRLVDFAFSCSQYLNNKCKGKAGTAYYMPPELLDYPADPSGRPFSFRATHDVWSMGVVFYQLANPGQDYMNFTSKDPSFIAKDIQIQQVKPSKYPYVPVNSVISAVLNKNYNERPTAGQVEILIRLARPLCIVNDQPYDRDMAKGIITTLGLDVPADIDDYTLCKVLTDHLNICKISNNKYDKKQLLKLAQMLGLDVSKNIESKTLCVMIQNLLQNQQHEYSKHVTTELVRALEYISSLAPRQLTDIVKNLSERYNYVRNEAIKLNLVNTKLLEHYRQEFIQKSLVYEQNASITFARIYKDLADKISQLILTVDPTFQVGGVPLAAVQEML